MMSVVLNPKIEIKQSPIEGRGLFAKELISKGEGFVVATGEEPVDVKTYTDEEFKKFTEWCTANGKEWDAVSLGNGKHRAAISDRQNHPGNYGNHSCDPNVKSNGNDGLVALRDIKPGEEITIDYALFSNKDWTMTCSCGALNCRKVVVGSVDG
jgi:SET domain-containing protein